MSAEAKPAGVVGDIDTTYLTQQRDMFGSGLVAQIGSAALTVWLAIKSHADFQTGEAWPGVRRLMELTGMASITVQDAIRKLLDAHMLRESRRMGRSIVYVARERMDVRIGARVICIVVVDYVPNAMRERLAKLRSAALGNLSDADVWAEVEVLPGPGMQYDSEKKAFVSKLAADEVPPQVLPGNEAAAVLPDLLAASASSPSDVARTKVKSVAASLKAKRLHKN